MKITIIDSDGSSRVLDAQVGDTVILSDMSQDDAYDRIELK